ncbi:helix-turn-helix domain-containing protein [Tabrizicola flagellatus]|uniref:helix-turn-helix domain-containing protein n=1 Tax=Tabrizicola flagellatus TaxID=2593021 RepID=UPI0011F38C89|nr:helix-turn-helix domain-containing protein [Tabrizicola flagellatus]
MTVPRPPAHLEPYVSALGVEAAIELFLNFGGTFLYIPRQPTPRSELVRVLGMEKALALADLAARTALPRRLPIGKKWIARVLKAQGLSEAKIATRLHVSNVTVTSYLRDDGRGDTDPRQSSLF